MLRCFFLLQFKKKTKNTVLENNLLWSNASLMLETTPPAKCASLWDRLLATLF